jgi:thioredoxin 1
MKETTNENFSSDISSNKNVIIEFSAEWCGPCKTMVPILEEIDSQNENISVFKVDADTQDELCNQFGIRNIPTTLYYRDGDLIDRTVGSKSKDAILSVFND